MAGRKGRQGPYRTVTLERSGRIATLTLNRPERLNALTFEVYAELRDLFAALADEKSVRVIIITGAGRGFCSGGDVEAIIGDLLRGRMGYDGVVITDDVGAAKAVAAIPVGQRATKFVDAGGDIVLTARPDTVPTMHRALASRMAADQSFAAGSVDS